MRTFKLTIDEEELKSLIVHHKYKTDDFDVARSSRIHDLTKRLNKRTDDNNEVNENNADAEREKATEVTSIDGWG